MVDSPDSRRGPDAPADDRSHSDEAFAFVRELAGIMNRGHVELPSFPAVAARVIQVLNDPSASAEQVVRVLGAEPALAARTRAASAAITWTFSVVVIMAVPFLRWCWGRWAGGLAPWPRYCGFYVGHANCASESGHHGRK